MEEGKWFVLRVAGRQVDTIIKTIGPDNCWRPLEKVWTKPARKHKPIRIEKPLIPGWLFVKESEYGMWDDLDGVYGVLRYGRLGTIWIEDNELNGLRSACDDPSEAPQGQLDDEVELPPIGSMVKLRGLLYGREGVVRSYDKSGYAVVDLGPMEIKVAKRLLQLTSH